MFEIIKKDFLEGLKNFKFWASVISERIKIEINVLKLIKEINQLNLRRDELLKSIGKEVLDSWDRDLEIKENGKIISLIRQIRELETQLESEKKKLRELEDMSQWKF
ncbi:MAG: Vsp/OspC family lipoprotein [Thermodesulfovibrio sp.]|nr:Vsp/OspC family lipoprotein [Thermodesulfovibrio sp.]MCX7724642.1 Vsp/OspC family lipoprotein [Thermodesulfovibrio sp.]